ncbi:MAG TPA: helical backbone metal receptor [Puia sp.]|nr:helical backbone metal receptor [Puia sp.]
MPLFTDQLGRTIALDHPPRRIISLVPSQTELLHTLGLEEEVVGITKFCVHPSQWFRHKTRIGGTKDIRPEIIDSLQPDLVIANKEENDRAQVEDLATRVPVWISDVATLSDALRMIRSVGELTGKIQPAEALATAIGKGFADLGIPAGSPDPARPAKASAENPASSGLSALIGPRTAYFIWRKPWMVAGGDTFIHDLLHRAGFTNVFAHQPRYPSVDLEALSATGCELVLLSSEPYPFSGKHFAEIREALPHALIRLVDGEIFSWYGSRLLQAPAYLQQLRVGLIRNADI